MSQEISKFNDPYERYLQQERNKKNFIAMDHSSKFARKFHKFKKKMGQAKHNMINGGMMGFAVGGIFGLALGLYSAVQTRRLISIPISALLGGISFGFLMACGSIIRSAELEEGSSQLQENSWYEIYCYNNNFVNTTIL